MWGYRGHRPGGFWVFMLIGALLLFGWGGFLFKMLLWLLPLLFFVMLLGGGRRGWHHRGWQHYKHQYRHWGGWSCDDNAPQDADKRKNDDLEDLFEDEKPKREGVVYL